MKRKEGYKMKRKEKAEVIAGALKNEKGMAKGLVISLLTDIKIGQTLLLQYNLASKATIENMVKILDLATAGKDPEKEEKTIQAIKGKGFTSVDSLVNFSYQLKPDQAIMLQSILEDPAGSGSLKKAVDVLLANYVYRQ